MSPSAAPPAPRSRGQAAVELLALVPAMVLCLVLAWQAVLAVQAWHLAGEAARAGARARQVGAPAAGAARAALPGAWARGMHASVLPDGRVRVGLPVPGVAPWPGALPHVHADAPGGPEPR